MGNGNIEEINSDGDLFVFYKEHLGTGHELGLKIADRYRLPRHRWDCPNDHFGKELDILFRTPGLTNTRLVLSADIMGVARSTIKQIPNIDLIEPVPVEDVVNIGPFLTTGICVHKWQMKHKRQELMIFLKALSISCGMFATSSKAIAILASELSSDDRFSSQFILDSADEQKEQRRRSTWRKPRLEREPSEWLAQRIVQREVYSPNLSFEFTDWSGSVDSISDQGIGNFRAWRGASRRFLRLRYLSNVDQSLAIAVCQSPGLQIPTPWSDKFAQYRALLSVIAFLAAWSILFIFGPIADGMSFTVIVIALLATSLAVAPIFGEIKFRSTLWITGNYLVRHSVVIGGLILMFGLILANTYVTLINNTIDVRTKIAIIVISIMSSIGVVYGSYVAQFLPRPRDD